MDKHLCCAHEIVFLCANIDRYFKANILLLYCFRTEMMASRIYGMKLHVHSMLYAFQLTFSFVLFVILVLIQVTSLSERKTRC